MSTERYRRWRCAGAIGLLLSAACATAEEPVAPAAAASPPGAHARTAPMEGDDGEHRTTAPAAAPPAPAATAPVAPSVPAASVAAPGAAAPETPPAAPVSGAAPPAPATESAATAAGGEVPHAAFLRAVVTEYFVPSAARFSEASVALGSALDAFCAARSAAALTAPRAAWVDALVAWDELEAIPIGPVLDRRSTFQVDYWPSRPYTIDVVVRSYPDSARTLDIVSATAKGLPALEYLLWPQPSQAPIQASDNHCAYARQLAGGVSAEAAALDGAFRTLGAKDWDATAAKAQLTQLVNQAFGAVETLRGKSMLRPASVDDPKLYARPYSGESARSWAARWKAIRRLLTGGGPDAASLERYLRDAGEAAIADKVRAAVAEGDAAMRDATVADAATAKRAAQGLKATETVLDRDVAPALHVTIGFRGNDGD